MYSKILCILDVCKQMYAAEINISNKDLNIAPKIIVKQNANHLWRKKIIQHIKFG